MERPDWDQRDVGASDEGIERVLQVLRRRWPVIIAAVFIAGLASFAFSKVQHKKYTATAYLLFGNNDFSSVGQQVSGLSAPAAFDPQRQSDTDVLLLTQGDTAARTAQAIGHLTPTFVSNSISVSPQGQSNVVSVSATATTPTLAARLANTYTAQFIASRRAIDHAAIKQAQRLVSRQLATLSPAQRTGLGGQTLADRNESLKILASVDDGNVRLVTPAVVPKTASSAGSLQLAGLGIFAGLVLGLGLAFLLDRLDRRLRDLNDVEEAFGFPVVGHIPESRALAEPTANENMAGHKPELEAFRMLRAHLRYFNIDREIKTILVTSIESGDGKTTVARNLALVAASMGTRTLLLEADLRKPDIARRIGLREGPGLADVLVTPESFHDSIQHVEVANRVNGQRHMTTLDVLVAGAIPPNPAELLESTQMETLLSLAESEHELVIVDAPPLAAVSDAIPLLRRVHGVLIVGRLDKNTRESARRFHAKLASLGAPVLGIVVNALKSRDEGYGYGRYGYDSGSQPPSAPAENTANGSMDVAPDDLEAAAANGAPDRSGRSTPA